MLIIFPSPREEGLRERDLKKTLLKLYLFVFGSRVISLSTLKARSFTRLNFVSSVRLVSSSRVYFYSVIANECEAIQLIYVVGVVTPTYNLSMTSRPRTVIPNLFRNLYLVRSEWQYDLFIITKCKDFLCLRN